MVIAINNLSVDIHTSESQTATAEDGTKHGTARHLNRDVASHATRSVILPLIISSTAKYVAVIARGTLGTHEAILVIHCGIAQNMAIFTTAEDTTPDAVGVVVILRHWHFNGDDSIIHISEVLVEVAWVVAYTLSATKHIAIAAA